jgi:hypothetical protein
VQTLPPVTVYTTSPTVTIFTVAPTPTATTPPTTVIPPTIDNSISLSASNALNGTSGGTMSLRVGDTTAHIYVELFLTNTSSITISGVKVNLSVNWQTSIVYTTPTITNTVGSANWIYNSGTFTTLPAIAVPPSGLHFVLDLSYTFPALTAANSSAYLISGYKYG